MQEKFKDSSLSRKPLWLANYVEYLKKKDRSIVSAYLQTCDTHKDKERMLLSFTSPLSNPDDKLAQIVKVRNFFIRSLRDMDKGYFTVIELGETFDNPHLHIQLFFREDQREKIMKAYRKTLERFELIEKRCKVTERDPEQHEPEYDLYVIKEFRKSLSDDDRIALYEARNRFRRGKNKHIKFYTRSKALLKNNVYRHLFHKYGISYLTADDLFRRNAFEIEASEGHWRQVVIRWTLNPIFTCSFSLTVTGLYFHILRQLFVYRTRAYAREHFIRINKHVDYG